MNDPISLLEFIRMAELLQTDYASNRDVIYPENISTFYRGEILKRIPRGIQKIGLTPAELTFVAVLTVRFNSCRELIRTVSRLWASSVEEILQQEAKLEESLDRGKLKKFVKLSVRDVLTIDPSIKTELFEMLTGDNSNE